MAIVTTDDKYYGRIADRIRNALGYFPDDEMYLPEEMPDKVTEACDTQYSSGYDVGYEYGYDDGYWDCIEESGGGYDTGYEDGWDDGWDAGYEVGYEDGFDDAELRFKDDIETARNEGFESGKAEGKQAVYTEVEGINTQLLNIVSGTDTGGKSYYDEFWDAYQDNGNRTSYANAFYNTGWNDITYNPKYTIKCVGNCYAALGYSRMTDTKVDIDISQATNAQYLFSSNPNLKTIRKLIISESTPLANTMFSLCTALENLTIEGTIGQNGLDLKDSTKLSKASIENVISVLSTTTSGLSVTFSEVAIVSAFGSTDSAEWTALKNTRPTWTISTIKPA